MALESCIPLVDADCLALDFADLIEGLRWRLI